MLDLSVAPQAVQRLVAWLQTERFVVMAERRDGRNNQYAEFSRGDLAVRISADRGDWTFGLRTANMTDWFHPCEWESWLDGTEMPVDLCGLDDQVNVITERWIDGLATAEIHSLENNLREIGDSYLKRRFGIVRTW
jgi:hypothetical protein